MPSTGKRNVLAFCSDAHGQAARLLPWGQELPPQSSVREAEGVAEGAVQAVVTEGDFFLSQHLHFHASSWATGGCLQELRCWKGVCLSALPAVTWSPLPDGPRARGPPRSQGAENSSPSSEGTRGEVLPQPSQPQPKHAF